MSAGTFSAAAYLNARPRRVVLRPCRDAFNAASDGSIRLPSAEILTSRAPQSTLVEAVCDPGSERQEQEHDEPRAAAALPVAEADLLPAPVGCEEEEQDRE